MSTWRSYSQWVSTIVLITARTVLAQSVTTLDAALCNNTALSTFAACNGLANTINYCAGPDVASGTPFVECYCNQQLFNSIFDCESEQRICYGNDNFDGDMQALASVWHSACDPKITYQATTPALSSLASTYDVQFCTVAASACAAGQAALQDCSISYSSDAAQYASCYCEPSLLSAEYTCGFLGTVSCLRIAATLSTMPQYTQCKNFRSLFEANPTVSASVSVTTTADSMSIVVTTPALPGPSSAGTTSSAISTSTASVNTAANSKVPEVDTLCLLLLAVLLGAGTRLV